MTAALDGTPPVVSGEDGLRVLEAALWVNQSLQQHTAFVAGAAGADANAD